MEMPKMCLTFNGLCPSTCGCGQTGETSAADRPRVLRKRLDKAGTYEWEAPDLRNGQPYLALVRLKGAGAGGCSSFRYGIDLAGQGGGEGCLVEWETLLAPGRMYRLVVGRGGSGGVVTPDTGYSGERVAQVMGTAGGDTAFDALCSAPGAPNQAGGRREPMVGSSEVVIPGAPGGSSIEGAAINAGVSGAHGGGQGGGREYANGVCGGGGSGGSCIAAEPTMPQKVVFKPSMAGGDGFIEIYTR